MNEKGNSLIGVVAALALCSVILMSFFSFFIQSKRVEQVTSEEYSTTQLSEEIVHIYENNDNDPSKPNKLLDEHFGTSTPDTEEYSVPLNNRVYYVKVEQIDVPTVDSKLVEHFNIFKITLSTDRDGQRKDVVTNFAYKEKK